jgi:hypothetical protein
MFEYTITLAAQANADKQSISAAALESFMKVGV